MSQLSWSGHDAPEDRLPTADQAAPPTGGERSAALEAELAALEAMLRPPRAPEPLRPPVDPPGGEPPS